MFQIATDHAMANAPQSYLHDVFLTPNPLIIYPGQDQLDNLTRDTLPVFNQKTTFAMNNLYSSESERLKTFAQWPLEWLDKEELALTGMFFTGEEDKVKCFFCGVEIGRWERDDMPVSEHVRWSPHCPLLRRRTTNNVPRDPEALNRILPPISYDVCGASNDGIEVSVGSYPESSISSARMAMGDVAPDFSAASFPADTALSHYCPKYRDYTIEAARIRSFSEWPKHMKQKPAQLAEAGFFYTGLGDRVKCFSCGGGLKDWDDGDDPWEQHALWLSNCRFLKLIKGQAFIDSALAQQKARESEEEAIEATEQQSAVAAAAVEAPVPALASTETVTVATPATTTEEVVATVTTSPAPASSSAAAPSCSSLVTDNIAQVAACPEAVKSLLVVSSECAENGCSSTTSSSGNSSPEEKLCKICYAAEYNTAFLPCGHVVACAKCASSVIKCPLCRKPFTDVMRVYFS